MPQTPNEGDDERSFCSCSGGELVEPSLHHGLSCTKGGMWNIRDKRQDAVRDVLFKWMGRRNIEVNWEVPHQSLRKGDSPTNSCLSKHQLNGSGRARLAGTSSVPVRSRGREFDMPMSRCRSQDRTNNNTRPKVMDLMVNWGTASLMVDVSVVNRW